MRLLWTVARWRFGLVVSRATGGAAHALGAGSQDDPQSNTMEGSWSNTSA